MTVHPRPTSAPPVAFDTRVLSNDPVNAEYRLLVVETPPGLAVAEPGQFFHLLCPHKGGLEPYFRRPMSIYRIEPDANRLSFLYKVTGAGTRTMAEMVPGERFNIFGPLGIGFSLPARHAPVVLLARGVGLATMAPLVPFAVAHGHAVTAILSARAPDLLMSIDEMHADGADVVTVTDTAGTSGVEDVEAMLHTIHDAGRMGAIYTCGSNRLLRAAQRVAGAHGLFGEVALEQQMACGVGMCHCCVRPFRVGEAVIHRRVCCEGPVFPLGEAIEW